MRSAESGTGSVTNSQGGTESGQDCGCVARFSPGNLSLKTFLLQVIGLWTSWCSPGAPIRKASRQGAFLIKSRWIPPSRLPWQPQLGLGGSAHGPSQSRSGRDTCGGVTCCCWGAPESCFRVNAGHWASAAGEGVEVKRSRAGAGRDQAGGRAAATAVAGRAEAQPEEPPPPGPRDFSEKKMDQPSGRSFMQVLCEKYSPENFPYRRGPGMGVHVPATPQGSPMKDRLNLPSVLVLNSCGITCAGDEREIAAFCAHVSELDLSDNKLEDWHEVSKIVSNVPQLEFLNLSSNPLNLSVLERTCAGSFSGVRKLVLNNSKASWETVHTILQELPDLEELFLCLNDYETVSCPSVCCHSLKLLHITDNNLQDWTEIRKLGVMFPSLDTLVLANNHLNAIEEPADSLARLFPNLRSISLHKSGLQSWEDIDKLNSFPKLEEVRLLGIPLLQPYTTEERRKLVVARLPSVSKLNGSVVTDGEREDSERFFIRYYVDVPQEEVPFRYHELITKYGRLEPLAEVDLRPQSSAKVEVHFNDQVEEMSIRLDQTVAELKKQLKTLVQLPTSSMLLYYFDHEAPFGPEEMKYSSRALHSFGIRDGDKIFVESKTK